MKLNKFVLVSMIMLAIIFMGAVSAAEDFNMATDVSVDAGELQLSSQAVDEIESGGEIADFAAGDDVKSVENSSEILGASDGDALGDDYNIITPEQGLNDTISAGNYKFEGTFTSDNFYRFILFDEGCVIDAGDAEFQDIGIILEGGVHINGLTLTSSQYLEDQDYGKSPGAIVYVSGDGNVLDGLTINYAPAAEGDAYGIYVKDAGNFQLLNSNINFTGSSLADYYEYAMRMESCEEVLIQGNTIIANLPILDVDYNKGEPGLATDLVLNTGIKEVTNLDIINNTFIAKVVGRGGDYPTLDCVMMESCNQVNVINNKFREEDFITDEGEANYLNVLDMYYSDNVLVQGNNIRVETTGGTDNAGTSYPIQLTGPYEGVVIDGNDLYANCGGPALGIFSQNYYGDTEITVQNNNIDITGLPTDHSWGLVSGIELQDNVARVYNNTITTKSVTGSFEEGMNLYGISYAQALMDDHNYDIRGNTIVTEGNYTIYLLKAQDTTISGNYLLSSTGEGDDTVYIRDAGGNTVIEDNHGAKEEPENIVTQDNFYEFFNDEGYLLDTVEFDELIFQGEFAGLVDKIMIGEGLSIVGDGATLHNIGFIIDGDGCKIDNLKFVADEPLGSLISAMGVYNVTVSNLDITYDGGDEMAVAVDIEADSVKVLNNTIFFESHVRNDEEFALGLKLTGCTDVLVDGNSITTKLPCVYVNNYDDDYYMMGSDKVDPVRIKDCSNLVFTNNFINSTTNDYSADFPTIQAIQILGCHDSILDHNTISMIDEMTPAGMDNYLYGINFGYNTNVTFSNNNFNMSTSGGKDAAGTAYAFQGVESEVFIIGNNITSISNGPNLGVYVASMFGGDSDLVITDNFINVTGSASSSGSWALVSGIEIQNGDAKIYNNTIYTYNVNAYDEYAYIYGISYAQWMYGDRSFDIQDNEVHTEGKYTISVIDAVSLNAERNILYAHDLTGDDSINPGECKDVTMGDNLPEGVSTDIIYVSQTGDDNNTGSIDSPVATIARAVELANAGSGKVIITEGTYKESNIELDTTKAISIAGEGNVIIDGNATSNSIFVMHGGKANFTNIKFINAKPTYGGAIFMNNGTGTSREIININVIVDNCTFDGLATSRRGGAIYAWYTEGNLIIKNSKFYNMEVSQWGGAVCAGYSSDGLNVEIENCIFENNTANNGGGAYLQAKTVSIRDSTFNNNSASYDSGAVYLYDATATIDNCIITNNKGGSEGVAIKFTRPTSGNPAVKTLTVTNSVIENNSAINGTLPAIYVDMQTLDISYCSIVNDLSLQTRTGQGYGAVYGQGMAVADNNWWGTNDPSTKVTGQNITIEKWVIMNVVASASEVSAGDEVTVTVDFNHVNTTAGEIEELTGGEIPKESYDVTLAAENGTISPDALTVLKGESKQATFTAGDANALITATCGEAVANIKFVGPAGEPYYGIIYVDQINGDDLANNGSQSAPVATMAKAVELALIEGGSGKIIVNAGTYVGSNYHVTGDLTVTGAGDVTLDADNDGRLFYMEYGDAASKIELSNLVLTNAKGYGAAVYSFANELILDNVTIVNNNADRYLIKSSGKLTIKDSEITKSMAGNVIEQSGSGDILIINTLFKDNSIIDDTNSYAVIYISSGSGNLVIEDSRFINNTARQGVIKGGSNYNINVKGTEFINNTNTVSQGGAIYAYGNDLTVSDCVFVNNKAAKDGGAIYTSFRTNAVVTKSTFINNSAGDNQAYGDAIYNGNMLSVNYCVFLTNAGHFIIFNDGEDNVVNAQFNWWGTNDNPSSLTGVGTYEDDYSNYVDCAEVDSSKWVFMNVTTNMTGDSLNVGDKVEITVDFTNYIDSTNALKPLLDSLPEITVSAGKVSRSLDATEATTVNGIAKFVYTADEAGEYAIRIVSGDAVVEIPINVTGSAGEAVIYVDGTNGADTNDGKTRESAVKTIEHAVDIANGKIIILAGEYTVNSLLNITKDLDIVGEGDVLVKSNAQYSIEVYDDWEEEWISEYHYEFLQNHANLNLSNIKVTLAPATTTDSLIYNYNNLFINNCEFNNIKVTGYKGVMRNDGNLTVNGTKFNNSVAKYSNILNYGELLVNNSEFTNNVFADTGASAQAIQSSTKATIVNTIFVNNKGRTAGAISFPQNVNAQVREMTIINCTFDNNRADAGNGGAVSMASTSGTLNIKDSTFNQNTASTNGQALYVQGTTTIETSVLNDNIYVYGGTTNIKDSIILVTGNAIDVGTSSPTVTANDNWWGTNDKPNDYAETWVKMDAGFAPENAHTGDKVNVTATFDNVKLPSGVIKVTFASTSGNLNQVVTVVNAQASVIYTIDASDVSVNATSGSANVVMPVQPLAPAGTIYVSYENGNDDNDGLSEGSAVKTIAHAIELANIGIGKIILLEGTHVLSETLFPTEDLDIAGQGIAIIDGNRNRFIQTTAGLNLTNIEFTNGYSTNNNLINLASSGKYLSLNNVKFYNNSGKYGVAAPADKRLTINNSEFYDNNMFAANQNSYGVIYSNSAITTIENTVFRNNTAWKGGAIWANRASSATIGGFVDIINCTFDGNIAQNGNGAAIFISGSVTVTVANSTFTNNLANASANSAGGYGSAVHIGSGTGKITIAKSVFINNTGNGNNYNDAGFYIGAGTLNITDSIILTNDGDTRFAINQDGGTVIAENNWWGNNDKANTNVAVNKIVTMTATLSPEDAQAGDAVNITVTFDNENLPKGVINVTFTSSSGLLNEVVTMQGAQASVAYAGDARDELITVKSSQAEQSFKFDPEAGIIFVLPGANDTNPGTRDAPVGTIAHALEIAKGKIVLLEGIHKTGYLGVILDDLTITGEGNAVIDAQNSNTILLSDANVVIVNVTMINGYSLDEGGLLSNTGELTLINCTLANSSAPQKCGGAINNLGKLTIINTIFANCNAKYGGAIFSQTQNENTSITVINSTFENNVATGKDMSGTNNLGGGAIYAQRGGAFYNLDLTIENTVFVNNEAQNSCGGAIALEQLDSTVKITDCEFVSNHAAGEEGLGGAIFTKSATAYERGGTMTITGTLFENNTCDAEGGAIYARTTTVKVESSVFINNTDADGWTVYGYRSEQTTPKITLNDNWWGTNYSPKNLVGGNGYKPELNRWVVLTAANASEIKEGETVQLTVSLNTYTDGTANGTLSKPITVKRNVTVATTFGDIGGVLENGEFVYDFAVPSGLKYIAANVDGETVVLYVVTTNVTVSIDDITAKKSEKVEVTVNVTSEDGAEINVGKVELYIGDELIATIPVHQNKAVKEILFTKDEGSYNLTAIYVDGTGLFAENKANATLTISGIVELTNETFFNFFDEEGNLRPEFDADELVFHGDFSGLGVDVITIPKTVAVSGDNAVLYDMAISLEAENSKLSDMKFIADGTDFTANRGAVILAGNENIELNNVSVTYTAPRTADAYAVYAYEATGFKLIDSTIVFDSDNAGAVHHAVHIANSDDINVTGNTVNASLPARDVNWHWTAPYFDSIDQETVLAIGIQGVNNGVLTQNEVNVKTKSAAGYAPTIDSIIVYGVKDFEISWNNITHVDTVNAGEAGYSNAIDLYAFDGVTVRYNNILVNSTAGAGAKGTAYPIQATGPYTGLVIDNNNLTSVSNGPALGIYSQNYDGITDIEITNNNINVTGIATENVNALVSGMELQDTNAKVYNNTIYSQSKGSYDDFNALYGISYSQYTEGEHAFDIRDNNVFTDGKFAIYLLKAKNSNVTGNMLYAHELVGDKAVSISSGEGNTVRTNIPNDSRLIIEVKDITVGETAVIILKLDEEIDGIANVTVGEKEYSVNITAGSGQVNVTDLTAGEYTVIAKFTSYDIYYGGSENRTVFNVAKLESDMNIVISDAELGENATISVSIPGATGNVTIYVNGKEEEIPLDENGTAAYTIDDIAAGDYSVVAVYSGDNEHGMAHAAATFTVDKLACEMNLITVPAKGGEKSLIKVNVTEGATGTVVIDINGTKYAIDLADGNELEVALDAGSYAVAAAYSGDNNYNATVSKEETLVVEDKAPANIRIEIPDDAKVGETITINITADTDAKLAVTINGEVQDIPAGSTGMSFINVLRAGNNIQLTYTIPEAGIYNIAVFAGETKDYAAQSVNKSFEATKKDAEINIAPIADAKVGDKVNITVDSETDGALTIKVNGEIVKGEYEITKAGAYTITVESAATANYNAGFATYAFNVEEEPATNMTVIVDGKEYNAEIVNGTPVVNLDPADNNATIVVDGVAYPVEIVNGTAAIDTNRTEPEMPSTVVVDGVEYPIEYVNGTATVTTNTVPEPVVPVMDITAPFEANINDNINVEVALPEDATGTVTVYVNGAEYDDAELEKGAANLTFSIYSSGDHIIEVKYSGDANYLATSNTTEIHVYKINATISAVGSEITEGETATVTVTIDADAVGVVLVDVAGNKYYAELDQGKAVVSIPALASGNYTATVAFPGDDTYEEISTTATIAVKAAEPVPEPVAPEMDITAPFEANINDNINVEVALPEDATGTVTVYVNGAEYDNTELENGVANLTFSIYSSGDHIIEVKYSGDANYLAASNTTEIHVYKINATISAAGSEITEGETATVTVTIDADAVGVILVDVAGNKYYAELDEGKAVVNVPALANGNYTATVTFPGDDTYEEAKTTVAITVKAAEPAPEPATPEANITVPTSAEAGETPVVDVALPADATGNVTVKVDGKEAASVPVKDGKASIPLEGLTEGAHVVETAYSGDDKYAPVSQASAIAVEAAPVPPAPVTKKDTVIIVDAKFTRVANDYNAGERGAMFYAVLKDSEGNILVNKTVQIAVNGPIYNVTTDDQGRAGLMVNLAQANIYTYALSFQGDDEYNAAPLASSKLTVTLKKTSITANSPSFKKTAKTKTVTATLKVPANPYDGKTYLKSGKKLTLKVAGKKYTASANAKGVVKFNIKLAKKGKYTASIKFAGDKTYAASSKAIKITIK